jgi:hypothetical protein
LGGWNDGIPFGLLSLLPVLLLGSFIGTIAAVLAVLAGSLTGRQFRNPGRVGFIVSIALGALGVLISMTNQSSQPDIYFWMRIPWYLVSILGIGLSLYFRSINRRKYTLTTVAFSIFLLNDLVGGMLSFPTESGFQVFMIVSTTVSIAAWIILLIALFSQPLIASERTSS